MLPFKLCKPKRFSTSSSHHNNNPKNLSLPTLLKTGFTPTLNHFNQFLLFLSQTHKFQTIIHFFSQLNSNQININSYTKSIFTNALFQQHKYEEAEEFMKTHISRCNRLWDSLIQGLCINKQDPERALSVLRDCLRIDGILPSSFTFCSLIHSFSNLGRMDRAIEVLELMSDEKINYPFDNFVTSKVISGFVKIGKPELAIGFYESTALKPNIVTFTALLSAYCKLGRIEEANELVSTIENNGLACDLVFYSCWIYEHFSEGILSKALKKYREMMEKKIELDTISYTILIDGFSKEGFVEKAVGFLKNMKKDKLEPNLITYTVIMLGFCKKGKLGEAFAVFKIVEELGFELDEFAYATLIDGFCKKSDFDRVFDLLGEMEKKGIRPSIVTYNILINGLCKAKRTNEGDEVSKGIVGDTITYATILHGYIKEENLLGMLETKRRIEESGVCMDVVMCNILIKALFMVGSFEDALGIYKEMPKMDLLANSITYCTMIDGYFRSGRISEALEIFDDFQNTLISSVECYNCILCGLCKNGLVNLAIDVFVEVNERGLTLDRGIHMIMFKAIFDEKDVAGILDFVCQIENVGPEICNDAICFLCKKGFSEAACDVYVLMMRNGLFINSGSYYSILTGLICNFKRWPTQPILNTFVKNYGVFEPQVTKILSHYLCMKDVDIALKFLKKASVPLPINVLERLTKNGRVLDAYKLVKGANSNLGHMDVVDYTIIIDGLCKRGYIDEALDICDFAKKNGIKLSIVTYNSILNGLCSQGCFVQAFRLFDSFEKINVLPSEITYGTLIDALSNEGHLMDARKLFERMILKSLRPNTRIYNFLINGYCKLGQLQEGLNLLLDLEVKSLKPDEFTVSALINGFCREGDIEGALELFYEFKEKDLLPDFLGFLYLIRGLCSKGEMEESRGVLKEMLNTESVVNLLNRVEVESETESVQNFLVFLCEQGRIEEAISVLNEVGSMFFPVRRIGPQIYETDLEFKLSNHEKTEEVVKTGDDYDEMPQLSSFDSYYNAIASLCSRGEILKANKFAKMIHSF